MSRSTVAILSFSPIHRDARVLRQVRALHGTYRLVVVGFGDPHPAFAGDADVTWHRLDVPDAPVPPAAPGRGRALRRVVPAPLRAQLRRGLGIAHRMVRAGILGVGGRLTDSVPRRAFWRDEGRRRAADLLRDATPDVIIANDWDGLVVAVGAVGRSVPVVYDAHEYAPLEWANRRAWRFTDAPMRRWALRTCAPEVAASMTVAPGIADRLRREYGLDPVVVLNAPDVPDVRDAAAPGRSVGDRIRMIHHGGASPDREPELMIRAVALAHDGITLDLMLLGNDAYIAELRRYAECTAPGRIGFPDPVPTDEIVPTLRDYDLGFYLLPPSNFNHRIALPNKLFDFIAAGLAVCVGPTEAMAQLVRDRGCGIVSPSFDARDVARTLDAITADDLRRMRDAARAAAADDLNAATQLAKVGELVSSVLPAGRERTG